MVLCNASAEEVVLVHDDLDVVLGSWKWVPASSQGGVAGNNGVRSTIDALGTKCFSRLKIGVGAHDASTHRKRRRAPKGSCTWWGVLWLLLKPLSSAEQHILKSKTFEEAGDHLFSQFLD
jgi:peptidyl-tRNA hydrolase